MSVPLKITTKDFKAGIKRVHVSLDIRTVDKLLKISEAEGLKATSKASSIIKRGVDKEYRQLFGSTNLPGQVDLFEGKGKKRK